MPFGRVQFLVSPSAFGPNQIQDWRSGDGGLQSRSVSFCKYYFRRRFNIENLREGNRLLQNRQVITLRLLCRFHDDSLPTVPPPSILRIGTRGENWNNSSDSRLHCFLQRKFKGRMPDQRLAENQSVGIRSYMTISRDTCLSFAAFDSGYYCRPYMALTIKDFNLFTDSSACN